MFRNKIAYDGGPSFRRRPWSFGERRSRNICHPDNTTYLTTSRYRIRERRWNYKVKIRGNVRWASKYLIKRTSTLAARLGTCITIRMTSIDRKPAIYDDSEENSICYMCWASTLLDTYVLHNLSNDVNDTKLSDRKRPSHWRLLDLIMTLCVDQTTWAPEVKPASSSIPTLGQSVAEPPWPSCPKTTIVMSG